jgi:restriction endonuclease
MPKWKRFERLAAALHVLKMRGAEVAWNEKINGWQVDVAVRFTFGPYRYLQIVECKDRKDPVDQGAVAEFVTKREKTGANKGVMVSASGFQSGAVRLAQEEGIDIFKLSEIEDQDWANRVQSRVLVPYAVNLFDLRVTSAANRETPLPDKLGHQYLSRIVLEYESGHRRAIGTLVESHVQDWQENFDERRFVVRLPPNTLLRLPDRSTPLLVTSVRFRAQTRFRGMAVENPDEQRPKNFAFENLLTGETTSGAISDLPYGFDSEFTPGHYYRDAFSREYYCEDVSEAEARVVLLGSIQHGQKFWAEVVMRLADAHHKYETVTDPPITRGAQ